MLSTDLSRHVDRYYGKHRGVVTGNDDPDKQGAVKVKVPSIFGAQTEVWAKPCFPYAHFYVPPVDARVWVEFEGGDPQYPIWVGAWYPKDAGPPESQVRPPDNRVIQTPSGHTIELNDKEGEAKIIVRHKDNSFLAIDDKGSVVISNKNGSTLYLNADKKEASILSEHGHVVSMTDKGIVLMNKDGASLDLAGDTVRITGATILLEGTTVSLGAGAAEPTLLANQFWTIFQAHTHPSAMGPTGTPLPPTPIIPPTLHTAAVVVK